MKLFQAIVKIDNQLNPKSTFTCKHKKIREEEVEIKEIIAKAKEEKVFDFEIEDTQNNRLRILITKSFEEKNGTMKIKLENNERRRFSSDEEVGHVKIIDQQNRIHDFVLAIA